MPVEIKPIELSIRHREEYYLRTVDMLSVEDIIFMIFKPSFSAPANIWPKIWTDLKPEKKEDYLKRLQVFIESKNTNVSTQTLKRVINHFFLGDLAGTSRDKLLSQVEELALETVKPYIYATIRSSVEAHLTYHIDQFTELVKSAASNNVLEYFEEAGNDKLINWRFRRGDILNWLGEIKFVEHLREKHIIIDSLVDELIAEEINPETPPTQAGVEPLNTQEEGNVEEGEPPFFPAPEGTMWSDVKIALIARNAVEISINEKKERLTYNQIGMSDRRRGDRPKMMWWFLVFLLKENGFISRASKSYEPRLTDTVKGFKVQMKNLFGIKEKVLGHYRQEKGYKANFQTEDRTQISLEELKRLPDAD